MRCASVAPALMAVCFALATTAAGQEPDHSQHAPAPQKPSAATPAPPAPADAPVPPQQPGAPAQRQRPAAAAPAPGGAGDHSAHVAAGSQRAPREPIPPLTDADRAAAFPDGLEGHAVHDRAINYMVLFDQLEWQGTNDGGPGWENSTWIGGDVNRLWLRSEGESHERRLESAFVDVLWGRSIARWWDLVAGARHDFRPGPGRTWVGAGIQGVAPYFFELEVTGYVGPGGRTLGRVEAEYELLLTNRLILQPLVEVEVLGKADPERELGAGLTSLETGVRVRYEFRREFAPFIGVTWNRAFFGTADFARGAGEDVGSTRIAVGLRTWF